MFYYKEWKKLCTMISNYVELYKKSTVCTLLKSLILYWGYVPKIRTMHTKYLCYVFKLSAMYSSYSF